ncbi:MAG: FtsX-like permease family protein [Bryobacteraceae bacterium]
MLRYLPLIAKNALRNRRRSILTICSIAASLCLLGVLLAMYHAFYFSEPPAAQALRLVTRNKVSLTVTMPIFYRQRIQQVPGVVVVGVSQWFGGVYKDSRDQKNFFARFAVEPDRLFQLFSEFRLPEDQKQAFIRDRTAAMVGKKLAERMGFKLGDRITLTGDIFPGNYDFTIRAIYDADENNESMYFNLDYLFESLPVGRRDFAGTFAILADSVDSVPRIARTIDEMFANSPAQTKTESERAFQLSFVSFLGNVKVFLLAICAAVTFTILLVSGNTMAMSVRERIREVGILKTLGFTPQAILVIILGEAAFISLIGGALGCLLASVLCAGVRQMPAFILQLKTLSLVPPVAAACILIALLIGVVSSLIPAWNASRTSILDSLRYSG